MNIFGWVLIRKEELEEYQKAYHVKNRLIECHRWFSGWKDLDIIWDYLFKESYFGGIDAAREDYAKKRGTNRYGVPI